MKFKVLLTFLLLFIAVPGKLRAQDTESAEIKTMLKERDQEIKELLGPKGTEYTQEKKDKLKDIINSIIDYESMAIFALEGTYDTLNTEQREEFVDLFAQMVRNQSLNKLDIYRADVVYKQIDVSGDSAFVNTIAILEDVRTPVNYTLYHQDKSDQWVITDMTIDDVSTAKSYRRQFQNIIRKRSYDFLVETLRKKVAK